jgi:ketosteroid isomerase-like protein
MTPVRMSKIESALRVVLAFNEALNRQDVEGMKQLLSDDCVFESADPAPDGAAYDGKEPIAQYWRDFFRKVPQAQIKIEDAYGFGDQCVKRWRYQGGDADAQTEQMRGVDIVKVKDGLICELFSYVKGSFGREQK